MHASRGRLAAGRARPAAARSRSSAGLGAGAASARRTPLPLAVDCAGDYDAHPRPASSAWSRASTDFNERVAHAGRLRPAARARATRGPSRPRPAGRRFTVNAARRRCEVPPGGCCCRPCASHDQYNTTIYGLDDRYRGIRGGRRVVFVNPDDIGELGLRRRRRSSTSVSEWHDGVERARGAGLPRGRLPDRRAAAPRRTSPRRTCWCRSTRPRGQQHADVEVGGHPPRAASTPTSSYSAALGEPFDFSGRAPESRTVRRTARGRELFGRQHGTARFSGARGSAARSRGLAGRVARPARRSAPSLSRPGFRSSRPREGDPALTQQQLGSWRP